MFVQNCLEDSEPNHIAGRAASKKIFTCKKKQESNGNYGALIIETFLERTGLVLFFSDSRRFKLRSDGYLLVWLPNEKQNNKMRYFLGRVW